MGLLVDQFEAEANPSLQMALRFNVAPTQDVAVVRVAPKSQSRELTLMRWGLIPYWADDKSIGNRMINARSESLVDKPAFRNAFKKRRCLVLSDGYFEWKKVEDGKQPFYIRMQDERPFAFAGLWEYWRKPGQDGIVSCTIITTDSNELTQPVHDRMPAILHPDHYQLWCDPTFDAQQPLTELLAPFPSDEMCMTAVSRSVNSPANDSPECISPVE